MNDSEKRKREPRPNVWGLCLLLCLTSFLCTMATGAIIYSGKDEDIAKQIFKDSSYYISAYATSVAQDSENPTDFINENNSILSIEQHNKAKRGIPAINVSSNGKFLGGTSALIGVEGDKFYLLADDHEIDLNNADPTSQANIGYIEAWRPGLDKPVTYYNDDPNNKNIEYLSVPGSKLVVISVKTENNPFSTTDVLPFDEGYVPKENEKFSSIGFPEEVRVGNKENYNHYPAIGIHLQTLSDRTQLHEIKLGPGSSGTPFLNTSGVMVGMYTNSAPLPNLIDKGFKYLATASPMTGVREALYQLQSSGAESSKNQ